MPFQILPVTSPQSDMPRLMAIQFAAFAYEPAHAALFPENDIAIATQRSLAELADTAQQHIIKCVDTDTDQIIGFVKWNEYDAPRPAEEWRKRGCEWFEGEARVRAEAFMGPVIEARERLLGGRPCLVAMYLSVDPQYQRRGAGTLLMECGLAKAKELGVSAYLEASPLGYPLYVKLGFRVLEWLVIKADDWRGERDMEYPVMIKDP